MGKTMKGEMWCLINKPSGREMLIAIEKPDGVDVVGFATKEGLLKCVGKLEYDEEIKKIKFEIKEETI